MGGTSGLAVAIRLLLVASWLALAATVGTASDTVVAAVLLLTIGGHGAAVGAVLVVVVIVAALLESDRFVRLHIVAVHLRLGAVLSLTTVAVVTATAAAVVSRWGGHAVASCLTVLGGWRWLVASISLVGVKSMAAVDGRSNRVRMVWAIGAM